MSYEVADKDCNPSSHNTTFLALNYDQSQWRSRIQIHCNHRRVIWYDIKIH
jgi:hypothetical protein